MLAINSKRRLLKPLIQNSFRKKKQETNTELIKKRQTKKKIKKNIKNSIKKHKSDTATTVKVPGKAKASKRNQLFQIILEKKTNEREKRVRENEIIKKKYIQEYLFPPSNHNPPVVSLQKIEENLPSKK